MRLASRPPTFAIVAAINRCTISVGSANNEFRFACAGFDEAQAGRGGRGLAAERVLDLRGAAREAGERRSIETFRGEHRHQAAHACAGVARVLVGGVAHERNPLVFAIGDEVGLGESEQRAREVQAIARRSRSDAGKPAQSRAAQKPEQHRFGLVVEVMRGHDDFGADCARMIRQQSVARIASPLLQARLRLFAAPNQRLMRDAQLSAEIGDGPGLLGAFRPQTVIDGGGLDTGTSAPPRPTRGHHQQGGRIRAAGDGQQQRRRFRERRQDHVDRFWRQRGRHGALSGERQPR